MRENPWSSLPRGSIDGIAALRISVDSPLEVFWGRKKDGRYIFLVCLRKAGAVPPRVPKLRGIETYWGDENRQLQLILGANADWEMFHILSLDLIESTRHCDAEDDALEVLVARLGRWQTLLSKGGVRILSESEIRGLIGELYFLFNTLIPVFGVSAVTSWLGPDGQPQDFAAGGVLVEVKTIGTGESPVIAISSPEQLWSESAPIYLHVMTLARSATGLLTLPYLIGKISGLLRSRPDLNEEFQRKLDSTGYLNLPEYGELGFDVCTIANFSVRDDFPRLLPSVIPHGVARVRYTIQLAAIKSFETHLEWNLQPEAINEH